jgi:hypothetical protein
MLKKLYGEVLCSERPKEDAPLFIWLCLYIPFCNQVIASHVRMGRGNLST